MCHSSAGCRPDDVVVELPACGDGRRDLGVDRTAHAIDSSELHPERREHLADVIVELARELLALFFLRGHELL